MQRRAKGEGSIIRLPDGSYLGRVELPPHPDGRRRRKAFRGPTRSDVSRRMREYVDTPATTGTVGETLDAWLDTQRVTTGRGTWQTLEHLIRHLDPLRPIPLDSLDTPTLQRHLDTLDASPSRRRRVGEVARRIFGDVATGVVLPRSTPTDVQVWTPDEVSTFLRHTSGHRFFHLYTLAIDTGMRQGELLALEWSDVEGRRVNVSRSLEERRGGHAIRPTKTRSGRRVVVISESTRRVLSSVPRRSTLVFPSSSGGFIWKSNVNRPFRRHCVDAGVRVISFHGLRHTSASLLLDAGVSVKVVSERLGHADIRTTLSTYTHLLPTSQERAADVIGSHLGCLDASESTQDDLN